MNSELLTAYVVVQQKSLDDDPLVPRWVKWLLRAVYQWYGWAAVDHNGKSYCKLEFVGIYDNASDARYAAMVRGGSYRELPLNCSLPEETCQFRVHDFPLSSGSPEYRRRKLPFVAVAREDIERLEDKVQQTLDCAEGKCAVKVV
jgi:hypothetical protein